MVNITVIQGHPDPATNRLGDTLAGAYLRGAEKAGHSVSYFDIAQLDFPILRRQSDWKTGPSGTPPSLLPLQQSILEADKIVLFYPLWFGDIPAYLKGALEQVLRPDVALKYGSRFPKPLLTGKSAHVFVTMSTPTPLYRFWLGAHSLKILKQDILGASGVKPVQSKIFGSVDHVKPRKVKKWCAALEAMGALGKD